MKKHNILTGLTAASFIVMLAAGCKKNNDGAGGISATFNGVAWQSQNTINEHPNNTPLLILLGSAKNAGDTTGIEIDIHDSIKVGIPDDLALSGLFYFKRTNNSNRGYSSTVPPGHGTILLGTYDQKAYRVAGTFSGVLYSTQGFQDSIKIENGHFNTTYTPD